jgi:hypothetical protein
MLRVAQLKGNYPISGVFIMILTYEEYLAWRRQSLSTDDWREQD